MNSSSGLDESKMGFTVTAWPDNQNNLPSYNIILDFRPKETEKGVQQFERDLFVSRIVSAVLLARPDAHQSHVTTIATTFERNTFEKSKGKEEYLQIFQAKLQKIQKSANRRMMAKLERREDAPSLNRSGEWKQELTKLQRGNLISQIASAILLVRPGSHQSAAAASVAKLFERHALDRSKDKEEYIQIFRAKLQQIRDSAKCKEIASLQRGIKEQQPNQFAQQRPISHVQQSLAQQQLQYYQQQHMRLAAQQLQHDQEPQSHRWGDQNEI